MRLAAILLVGLFTTPLAPLPASAQEATDPAADPAVPVGPGVSHELARHRAATLSDLSYDLRFRVPADLTADVSGEVTIGFRRSDRGPLVIDFADPSRIRRVRAQGRPVDFEAVHTHLVIPEAALPAGRGRSPSSSWPAPRH